MPKGLRTPRAVATARAVRRLALPLLAAGSIAATAALPSAAAASRAPHTSSPARPAAVSVSGLSPEAIEELLAGVAAGKTGIPPSALEVSKLAEMLAELPGFDELPSFTPGGTAEVEAALREQLEALLAGQTTLGELLSPSALTGLIEQLEAATHLPIAKTIETLLGKSPQALLEEGLGSTDLSKLLAQLLGSSEEPSQLLDRLLEGLSPAALEELLGTLPSGDPLENLNVGELAGALGKTPEALAQALGQTAASLPATAAAVTRTLENGDKLALLDGTEGVVLALLAKGAEGVEELGSEGGGGTTVGGRSSGGAPGGSGGAGGSPGTTTIVLTSPAGGSRSASSSSRAGRLTIVSRKAHGGKATLVVQVPSAGRLTLSGGGVKKVAREAPKAERMTITTTLTKARAASLRKRHGKRTSIRLTAAFAPVAGAASKATTSVTLR